MKKVLKIIKIILSILSIIEKYGETVDKDGNGIPDVIDDVIAALRQIEIELKSKIKSR